MINKKATYEWEELSNLHDDFQSDPTKHAPDCDCHRFVKDTNGTHAENAVDHCNCNYYEAIEQYLLYIDLRKNKWSKYENLNPLEETK